MNRIHHWICSSNRWKRTLANEVFPRVLDGVHLGKNVLEVGPGPGLATELLRLRCERLTCLEIDPLFVAPLRQRLQNTNVNLVEGDATTMPFGDGEFTAAVSLTMLHHVPTPVLQDRLFAEVHRVLQPGCVFVGMDVVDTWSLRLMHWGDTLVPVDPAHLESRLGRAGFEDVLVEKEKRAFRFLARRPARSWFS
jgi:ubiquinone/menaquinone biosynthesis C-methylase UbiE